MKIKFTIILLLSSFSIFAQNRSEIFLDRDSISFSSGKRKHQFDDGDTLYTRSGYKFYYHQVLKIGAGSGEKGYFKYIFLVSPSNTDMAYVGTGGLLSQSPDKQFLQGSSGHKVNLATVLDGPKPTYNSYNSSFDLTSSMPPTSSGKEFVVVNLKKTGSKNIGYSYSPVIAEPTDGIFGNRKGKLLLTSKRYYIDYENAVNSGELIYQGKQPINKNSTTVEVKLIQNKNESTSVADELAKLKKLFDAGAITKEEYDVAKKKLLDKL